MARTERKEHTEMATPTETVFEFLGKKRNQMACSQKIAFGFYNIPEASVTSTSIYRLYYKTRNDKHKQKYLNTHLPFP